MPGKVVSREEWLAARKELLEKEKAHTRANDALSAARRELPMVKVDKTYTFTGTAGTSATFEDLFGDKDQLIVYHFMFAQDDKEVCRGCTHVAETLPDYRHLGFKNTSLVLVSRGPIDMLEAEKKKNGWNWPWYSSGNSDFNYDFGATIDSEILPPMLNFRNNEELKAAGLNLREGDVPGFSVFLKKDDGIYHTYSTFHRGVEMTIPTMMLLDLTPLGRQIGPMGPSEFRLRGEYDMNNTK